MLQQKSPTATGSKIACVLFLLVSSALLVLALKHESNQQQEQAQQRVALASEHLAEQLNDNLRNLDLTFDHLAGNPWAEKLLTGEKLPVDDRIQLQRQLRATLLRTPLLSQIQLVNNACVPVFDTDDEPSPSLLQSNLCFWLHSKGRRADQRTTEIGGQDKSADILHAVKLKDAEHNTIGMVIGILRQSSVISAMNGLDAGAHGELWIQDRHEHLLLHSPELTANISKIHLDERKSTLIMRQERQQIFASNSPLDQKPRLYSVRTLENYPLRVAVGRSSLDETTVFSTQMATYFVLWLALVILCLLATRRQLAHIHQTRQLLESARRLYASENQIVLILENMPIAAVLVDQSCMGIHYANPCARAMLNLEEACGTLPELDDAASELRFDFKPLSEWLQAGHRVEGIEVEIEDKDQRRQWVLANAHPIHLRGQFYSLLLLQDRNQQKTLEQALHDCRLQLAALVGSDPLTQLANRHAAEQALRHEVSRCQRYGQPMALIYFDLDHFRGFNERHGHEAGDNVLRAVAQELKNSTRATDICARVGGEEFMVIFTNTPLKHAYKVMDRIRDKMSRTILPLTEESISFSGGITSWRLGDTPEEMEHRAEGLLRQAKSAGRNRLLADQD